MKNFLLLMSSALLLLACSSGGAQSGSSNPNPPGPGPSPVNVRSLSISNTAMIPLSSAKGQFLSTIYINNSSNKEITDIHYSVLNPGHSTVITIPSTSVNSCTNIPANSSCALGISVNASISNGAVVRAEYMADGKQVSTSQVINVGLLLPESSNNRVYFSGSTNLVTSAQSQYGYATLYLMGGGRGNQYVINDIKLSNPSASIVSGYYKGMHIASGFVQSINIRVPKSSGGQMNAVTVTIDSSISTASARALQQSKKSSQQGFKANVLKDGSTNSVTLGVLSSSGPVILNTQPDLLNLNESTSGSVLLLNVGDVDTASLNVTPTNVTMNTTCGSVLAAGDICPVTYNVKRDESSANGSLAVSYTPSGPAGGVLNIGLGWYESSAGALVVVTPLNPTLVFNSTQGLSSSITYANIGGYDLNNFTPSLPVGSGSAVISNESTTCASTLRVGEQCSYSFTINDSVTENGSVHATVNSTYLALGTSGQQNYYRTMPINYISQAYAASLTLIPNPLSMSILGDNFESVTKTFTVLNVGTAPAAFIYESAGRPSYFTVINDSCTNESSLNALESCTVTLKLGPTIKDVTESGTVLYTFNYHGGQTESTTAIESINYQVLANTQGLIITEISAMHSLSGDGESDGSRYIFDGGSQSSSQSITVTYQNAGTNSMVIKGYTKPFNPYWIAGSGCASNTTLAPGETCSITYNSTLLANVLFIPGSTISFAQNITLPHFVLLDSDTTQQFYLQPLSPVMNDGTIYADAHVAVLTPNVMYDQGNHKLSYDYALSGFVDNYGPIVLTTRSENYKSTADAIFSNNCSISTDSSSSLLTQQCTFDSADAMGSVEYFIESAIWYGSVNTVPLSSIFTTPSTTAPVVVTPRTIVTDLIQ